MYQNRLKICFLVHKICLDNNYWLIFDVFFSFGLKTKNTGRILFKRWIIPHYFINPFWFKEEDSDWCCLSWTTSYIKCLAYQTRSPSSPIISHILRKSNVLVYNNIPMLCHRCLEGKFTKLHFNNDVFTSICPFEVVHTDMRA